MTLGQVKSYFQDGGHDVIWRIFVYFFTFLPFKCFCRLVRAHAASAGRIFPVFDLY